MRGDDTHVAEDDEMAALALMEKALALLDRCDSLSEIGAQLDLALCRLRDRLGITTPWQADVADQLGTEPWLQKPDSYAA